jgi:homoserine O-acetyltransferase
MNSHVYHRSSPFELEYGEILEQVQVQYHSFGTLNNARDNAVLVCHALTANSDVSDWWAGLFGIGKTLDPSKHFIICANNLGSPYGTTSAKSINPATQKRYALDFPFFTIRDAARLQLDLLHHLNIAKLAFIMGGSCGGNIAQEIAYLADLPIEKMVLMCCSAQETPWVIGIHEAQRVAMKIDDSLYEYSADAGQRGLYASRAFALSFYRSHPSIKLRQSEDHLDKIDDFKASSYIRYQGQKFIDRYDAHCYYTQLTFLDTHHIGRGRSSIENALSQIKIPTLCIGFDTDLLIPVAEQKYLAQHLADGRYVEVKTLFGHDAFLIETGQLDPIILGFVEY